MFSQHPIWIIALEINPQKESGLLLKYMYMNDWCQDCVVVGLVISVLCKVTQKRTKYRYTETVFYSQLLQRDFKNMDF